MATATTDYIPLPKSEERSTLLTRLRSLARTGKQKLVSLRENMTTRAGRFFDWVDEVTDNPVKKKEIIKACKRNAPSVVYGATSVVGAGVAVAAAVSPLGIAAGLAGFVAAWYGAARCVEERINIHYDQFCDYQKQLRKLTLENKKTTDVCNRAVKYQKSFKKLRDTAGEKYAASIATETNREYSTQKAYGEIIRKYSKQEKYALDRLSVYRDALYLRHLRR